MNEPGVSLSLLHSAEFEKAIIVLSMVSASVSVGLFGYLARATGRRYFKYWTGAFVFFALHLVAAIILGFRPNGPWERAALCAATAIGGLFMLWGDCELAEKPRSKQELTLACTVLTLWSYTVARFLPYTFWFSVPPNLLWGASGVWAAFLYWQRQDVRRRPSPVVCIFFLWGLLAIVVPFLTGWPVAVTNVQLGSSLLAVVIAVAMIMEEERKISEEKYRGVLDSVEAAIFLVDLWSLDILDLNKAAQQLMKCQAADLVGKPIMDLCPDLQRAGDNQLDHRAMFNAVFKPYNDFHIVRCDGGFVLCEGDTHLVQWHQRPVLQISVREVEKKREIGQLVRRAEKLSSLGQLVAGVAHELNNPLAVVVGYAQIMSKQKLGDAKIQGNILKILHESERAAKIVRDLLTFARPCEPQLVVSEINHLVSNVLEVRDADLRGNQIVVVKRLNPDLPKTKADPIQIEQVLTNLITNAVHAMTSRDGSHTLTIETEENGFFIRVTVEDNGPGIPRDILGKIFDPFFTTKAPGKGTGLGLSISNSILQEHRGKIWVQSEVGKGTKFYLELPIVPCEPETAAVHAVTDAPAPKAEPSDQRLLIVDDEPGIRDVLKEILEATGYTVETACSGTEAVGRISSSRFDVIISDLCMPGMDGEKLYQTIRDSDPGLARRMIFVTGDTVSPKSRTFLEQTGNRWLSKPFNIADIEETVRTLLGQDPLTMLSGHGLHASRSAGKYRTRNT